MMLGRSGRGLGRYCLSAICRSLRIAGRLLDAARRSLSRRRSLLSLAGSGFSTRCRLIGPLSGVLRALSGVGLTGRAPCQQRKG